MPSANALTTIQKLYIAYYGRAADAAGQNYWANEMDKAGGSLNGIIDAFATAPEAQALYGSGTTVNERITVLYQNILGRAPEADGLDYWAGEVAAGRMSLGNAALSILNGVPPNSTDAALVNNRLAVANTFTAQVNDQNYGGDAAAAIARTFLKQVTGNAATLTEANNQLPAYLNTMGVATRQPDKFAPLIANGLLTNTAIVSPTLTAANLEAATRALVPTATGAEDSTSIGITLSGSEVNGTVASFVIKSLPANGTLMLGDQILNIGSVVKASHSAAALTFVPAANFYGATRFTFAARDSAGREDTTPATATITVTPVNDAPVGVADRAGTPYGTPVTIDVLANDTDADNANQSNAGLSIKLGSVSVQATQGTATIQNGKIVFAPAVNFSGRATISYVVTDGKADSAATAVVINVAPNDGKTLVGGAGNDSLNGSAAADQIHGLNGDDILNGFGGNDTLEGGQGADTLTGSAGNDTFLYTDVNDLRDDELTDFAAGDLIDLSQVAGLKIFFGDIPSGIYGTNSAPIVRIADFPNTTIRFYNSNSSGFSAKLPEKFALEETTPGSKILRVAENIAKTGTDNAEKLVGANGNDTISGLSGNDFLQGLNGNDKLIGGTGIDTLEGGQGADTLTGGEGNDIFLYTDVSHLMNDELTDFAAGDLIDLSQVAGLQIFFGDVPSGIYGTNSAPIVRIVDFPNTNIGFSNSNTSGFSAKLTGKFALEETTPGSKILRVAENITKTGTNNSEKLVGANGNDTLSGLSGNDVLQGLNGNDLLIGSAGLDTLEGGHGADTLTGGEGNDVFLYTNINHLKDDVLSDFTVGDLIDMSQIAGLQIFFGYIPNGVIGTNSAPVVYIQDFGKNTAIRFDNSNFRGTSAQLTGKFALEETAPGSNILRVAANIGQHSTSDTNEPLQLHREEAASTSLDDVTTLTFTGTQTTALTVDNFAPMLASHGGM